MDELVDKDIKKLIYMYVYIFACHIFGKIDKSVISIVKEKHGRYLKRPN